MERLRRAALMAGMMVVGLNIWTGNPLLALWVGSRVVGSGPATMGAIGVIAAMIGVVGIALAKLLAILGGAYDRATGHTATVHRHVPWLRSMRAERVEYERDRSGGLAGMEVVIVAMVVLAVAAFEVWFFFYSSSPIDQRSGRH
jgi:hypothetical protein